MKQRLGETFNTVIADAGYGSEENYEYLEKNNIKAAVKYTTYEKEMRKGFYRKTFVVDNWKYDENQKEYTCPQGNHVPYVKTIQKKNASG